VLADDAARAQLVGEARDHVLRFDWAEVARRTQGVYASLVGSVSPAP
jgi:glycogen(starch) synthase